MHRKNTYIILGLILISSSAIGQAIQGRIVDAQTNEPLTGASIEVINEATGTVTDALGQFIVSPGTYPVTLVISHVGYESISKEVSESTTLNIRITASTQNIG